MNSNTKIIIFLVLPAILSIATYFMSIYRVSYEGDSCRLTYSARIVCKIGKKKAYDSISCKEGKEYKDEIEDEVGKQLYDESMSFCQVVQGSPAFLAISQSFAILTAIMISLEEKVTGKLSPKTIKLIEMCCAGLAAIFSFLLPILILATNFVYNLSIFPILYLLISFSLYLTGLIYVIRRKILPFGESELQTETISMNNTSQRK